MLSIHLLLLIENFARPISVFLEVMILLKIVYLKILVSLSNIPTNSAFDIILVTLVSLILHTHLYVY